MPRTRIELGLALDQLSILDETGSVDESLDPQLPAEDLRRLYRFLLLVRSYDERRLRLQRQGRIGTFAPVQGQEAAQLGSVYCIEPQDWVVPSFRELAVAIWRGMSLEDDLLFCAGFDEGARIPPEAHDLPISIPVASQIPHAVGLAWGLKLQKSDRVVLCYFGDGATSEGDFHEALNFASLHQVPIILFCQNNQWAISVPRREQTHSRTLAQKAFAYDIPGVVVDGNDLLAVAAATREAVARARQGRGPTFIEAITYRMGVHTTADDPTLYRGSAEVEEWARRDPRLRLRTYLMDRGLLTQVEENLWVDEAKSQVDAAVQRFEQAAAHVDPLRMFDHLYAELPPHLEYQRRRLEERLSRRPPPPRPRREKESDAKGQEKEEEEEKGEPIRAAPSEEQEGTQAARPPKRTSRDGEHVEPEEEAPQREREAAPPKTGEPSERITSAARRRQAPESKHRQVRQAPEAQGDDAR